MRLTRLATRSFRNLEDADLDTNARFVVLHGANAQGKTNALEAIYMLATLRPLRARKTRELIRWGGDSAAVAGSALSGGIERRFRVDLDASGRRATLDGKGVTDVEDYFAGIRAIAFTPQDTDIVLGEPALRRTWVDRAAFNRSPAHLAVVRSFRRCLGQKGAALREDPVHTAMLDALDEQLAVEGGRLAARRQAILRELEPHVCGVYRRIAGHEVRIDLKYRTTAVGETPEACTASLRERLRGNRREERRRRTTLTGPQRDDVVISIDDAQARPFGSRGQVRSLVLSLKLAELVAARARGEVPLFLFDDVSSELDRERTERLVEVLTELGTQVFATTTEPGHLGSLPSHDTRFVAVAAGALR